MTEGKRPREGGSFLKATDLKSFRPLLTALPHLAKPGGGCKQVRRKVQSIFRNASKQSSLATEQEKVVGRKTLPKIG